MENSDINAKTASTAASEENARRDFGGDAKNPRARKIRRRKALKIALVSLIALLLIITSVGAAILMPLLQAYNDGYVEVPTITPQESFSIPPFNSGSIDATQTWPETEYPEDSTDYQEEIPNIGSGAMAVSGIVKVEQKDPNVENILLIGSDTRDLSKLKGSRSDTMIICSYNKKTGKAKMISLLRDSLVYIPGYGYNRLNATFSLGFAKEPKYGGIALCINTINQTFDLDIQKFVIVNFGGAVELVDACGGVDIPLSNVGKKNNTDEKWYIEQYGGTVTKNADGTYHLNGGAALIHMRHRYGSSDYTRTTRQRNVITAVFRQVVASRDLTEIYDLVRSAFGMIKTNISLDEMIDLAASVVSNGANMDIGSKYMPQKGTSIRYNISQQVQVSSGGASVIKINVATEKSFIQNFIYGK